MKNRDFRPIYHFVSETIQDRAMVTVEHLYELLNGVRPIFNDFESHLTQILRARHYSTLNISETVQESDIVTTDY